MIVLGCLSAIIGALVTVGFTTRGRPVWDDWILDERGRRADATVVGRDSMRMRSERQWVYEVRWRALDPAGATVEGTALHVGDVSDAIAVEYDPQDPTRSRFVGAPASHFGAYVFIPFALSLLGSLSFVAGIRRVGRRKALYRDGTVAAARVVRVQRTLAQDKWERILRLTVRFPTAQGERAATCYTTDSIDVGAEVWVIYDPERPTRALLA